MYIIKKMLIAVSMILLLFTEIVFRKIGHRRISKTSNDKHTLRKNIALEKPSKRDFNFFILYLVSHCNFDWKTSGVLIMNRYVIALESD